MEKAAKKMTNMSHKPPGDLAEYQPQTGLLMLFLLFLNPQGSMLILSLQCFLVGVATSKGLALHLRFVPL